MQNFGGDRCKLGVEVLGRLDDDDMALRGINVDIGEQFRGKRLGTQGVKHDIDARTADRDAVAQG